MFNRLVVAGAMIVAAGSTAAMADQVDMRFTGTGPGQAINLQVWVGSTRVYDRATFAGGLRHQFRNSEGGSSVLAGHTISTFCTDILESVDSSWRRYSVVDVQAAPQGSSLLSNAMGDSRAGALRRLYGYGMTQGLLNSLGGWANGDNDNQTNRDQAAAWQLLVWEIVFDNPFAADWAMTGTTRFGQLRQQVGDFFSAFRDASEQFHEEGGLAGVSRGGSQDQLVVIPLPPAAWAGLGLIGGLMGMSYLRRRSLKA